jgi:hypothetical protein
MTYPEKFRTKPNPDLGYKPGVDKKPKSVKPSDKGGFDYGPDAKAKRNLMLESVYWDGPQPLPLQYIGKAKGLRFRSLMIPEDSMSKNKRKYLKAEVAKSTNTWINRPVTINHAPYDQEIARRRHVEFDPNLIVGNTDGADYEDGVGLWVTGLVKKSPVVDMIRNKSADIKGTSAEADYLFNECVLCHKKFEDEETWRKHMEEEHFVKDLPTEPHGIIGKAVTLVLSPEIPGLPTTLDVMETKQKGLPRLYEMILSEKAAVLLQTTSRIGVGKTGLKLGEPFADYKDMDDCIAKNKDKDDPAAYCADIMRKVEGEPDKPKEQPKDSVTEAQAVLDASPEPYQTAWQTVVKRFDEVVLNTPQYQAEQAERKRANDLKEREIALKENKVSETLQDNKALSETILQQEKKITEYENQLDKVKGKFKAGAAGNEIYSITEKQKDRKAEPDWGYKPGG